MTGGGIASGTAVFVDANTFVYTFAPDPHIEALVESTLPTLAP